MNTHVAENTHWYREGGIPVTEVPKADGKGFKKPTLREAKLAAKAGDHWVPGTTSIIGCVNKPSILNYSINQALEVALTSPLVDQYRDGEIEEARFMKLIRIEIDRHKNMAAEGGKRLHFLSEFFVENGLFHSATTDPERAIVEAIEGAIVKHLKTPDTKWVVEESFAHLGLFYGGRIDRRSEDHSIYLDIKTQEWKEGGKPNFYPENPMQLAAYAIGRRWEEGQSLIHQELKDQRLLSVVAHRCRPEVWVKEWTEKEAAHAWSKFNAMRRYFLIDKKLGIFAE